MCVCVCVCLCQLVSSMYIYHSVCFYIIVSVCLCVCVAFSAEEEGRRVGGKLASLISRLIDCEKFEDDILRKRGGRGAA